MNEKASCFVCFSSNATSSEGMEQLAKEWNIQRRNGTSMHGIGTIT